MYCLFSGYHKFKNDHRHFLTPCALPARLSAIRNCVVAYSRKFDELNRSAEVSRPHFVTEVAGPPVTAAISNTRFVPGGDHFMTTSVASIAGAESSPEIRAESFDDCVEH